MKEVCDPDRDGCHSCKKRINFEMEQGASEQAACRTVATESLGGEIFCSECNPDTCNTGSPTSPSLYFKTALSKFVSACDPQSSGGCHGPNSETYQLNVTEVCDAVDSSIKLNFAAIKKKLDPIGEGGGCFSPQWA